MGSRCRAAAALAAAGVVGLACLTGPAARPADAAAGPIVPGPAVRPTPAPAAPGDAAVGGPAMATTGTVQSPGSAELPETSARAFLVADLDSGAVYAARAPHERLRPASTLKLLTALALLPRLHPATVHVGSPADTRVIGSTVGIIEGGRYTVADLWYALLLQSGNDAANALAEEAGGLRVAIGLMNEEAARLGAKDTRAVTPEGLDNDGQLSSAYDLALIGRAAFARADLRRYSGARTHDFPRGKRPGTYEIQNANDLLGRGGVFAGKNGFTTLAGNTYVGAAERDGRRMLVVTLRPVHGGVFPDSASLLRWGFGAASAGVAPIGQLVDPLPVAAVEEPVATVPEPQPSARPGAGPASAERPAAARAGAPAGAPITAATAGAVDARGPSALAPPLRWLLVLVALLAVVVLALRTRVLLRRARRRRAANRALEQAVALTPASTGERRSQPVGAG